MAILLTALSVNATPVKVLDIVNATTTTQNQVDALSFGKTITYFIDSSQQVILGETEGESLPLSLDDSLFLFIPNGHSSTKNSLNLLQTRKKSFSENTSFSTYYTKQLLFPFHSHW